MAYVTGAVNSFADLPTAIRNACTANGWTLSGDVLHKGTCFARVRNETGPFSNSPPANGHLSVLAGNGIDGSNALVDAAGYPSWLGRLSASSSSWPDWVWPATYHIHVHSAPDEVWVLVNYNVDFWQWLAFGQSPAPGNAGTGNWHGAAIGHTGSRPQVDHARTGVTAVSAYIASSGYAFAPQPFWMFTNSSSNSQFPNGSIHGVIDDVTGNPVWSNAQRSPQDAFNSYYPNCVGMPQAVEPLLGYSPNAWNGESILLPMQLLQRRLSNKSSLIGEFKHARLCRNDFIEPGEVITKGPDRWKVYPFYRKSTTNRDGDNFGFDHSGTFALAVRYDGP